MDWQDFSRAVVSESRPCGEPAEAVAFGASRDEDVGVLPSGFGDEAVEPGLRVGDEQVHRDLGFFVEEKFGFLPEGLGAVDFEPFEDCPIFDEGVDEGIQRVVILGKEFPWRGDLLTFRDAEYLDVVDGGPASAQGSCHGDFLAGRGELFFYF